MDKEISKRRWLNALEQEKRWNRKRQDIEKRIINRRFVWAQLLALLKDTVTFDNSKRILDIGSEATSIFLALRQGKKYAVDPIFEYLFDLHPFLKEIEEYKDVNFISSPFEDMETDETFDIVFSIATINHINSLKPFIDKIDKLLLPSGMLILIVECYSNSTVKNIMNFFDVNAYHPHHFIDEDIIKLFSHYELKKRAKSNDIYDNAPPEREEPRIKMHRIDRIIATYWRLLGEWGRRWDILFVLKFSLCYALAAAIALLGRRGRSIYPFTIPELFVLQKR